MPILSPNEQHNQAPVLKPDRRFACGFPAALDAKAEYELFARIGELFADRSVLPTSHRFSTVRSADRIYVLNEG